MQTAEVIANQPETAETIALVKGLAVTTLPKDLYIPPDAMKVFLEAFEGPLDLLLYLIKKQNIDILDIPVAEVTRQYMEYVDIMKEFSLELAAEYLVMAALLAEVKSRMLLPRSDESEASEEDPRAELIRRLQEYERFKQAAESLNKLPRLERDLFTASVDASNLAVTRPLPSVALQDLVIALVDVLQRAELHASHQVHLEALSVRERMTHILAMLQGADHVSFYSLFNVTEGRKGVVVSFLAMLELLKEGLIEFVQAALFGPIYLKVKM